MNDSVAELAAAVQLDQPLAELMAKSDFIVQ